MARNDNPFEPKLGAPRSKGRANSPPIPRFTTHVLRNLSKASGGLGARVPKRASRPGAKLGRGHVAAKMAGRSLGPRARRVIVKTRLVACAHATPTSTRDHLKYLQREGVSRDGERASFYSAREDAADRATFEARVREDRHQFRFIVSPEDAHEIEDLRTHTRALMGRMERDLGTRLEWIAVDHWDTDNPHTHILLRGKDESGEDLIISREYIRNGMRLRAREVATEWLGLRTELEIRASLHREVEQERWTSLDETLQRGASNGKVDLRRESQDAPTRWQRSLQIGRLQQLTRMGLAQENEHGIWTLDASFETTLRAMGERGDIIRTMQRAVNAAPQNYAIFDPAQPDAHLVGRIAGKGSVDELTDRGYLVLEALDGKVHYATLGRQFELAQLPVGGIVEVRGVEPRPADRNILAMSEEGLYRPARHRALATGRERDPEAYVQAHVRRLEALRHAGIVERVQEGLWRIPPDLPAKGRAYDLARSEGAIVELRSHLSITQQVRTLGATWLDQQLLTQQAVPHTPLGEELRQALREREAFLLEHGFAERRGQQVILMRNVLPVLRSRELNATAQSIAAETGLTYHEPTNGERVSGVYRRSVQLASGRFAMLDDGIGFTLVPWRPVIEQRLGQKISAVVWEHAVSWELSRDRGLSL